MTLPPLSLDDIRVAGPDRDNAEAFDPAETWWLACEKIAEGYLAASVADVLLTLPDAELAEVAQYWIDHTSTTLEQPALYGRDFNCPDLRLCLALQAADPCRDAWGHAPTLEPSSLWEAVQENIDLKTALTDLLREARAHNDALNTEDPPNGPQSPTGDDYNALLDMIEAAGVSAFGKGEG